MYDKHPAKKHNIPWVHQPADSTICMHCLSLVKPLCYTDLPQKEELLGRCLLKKCRVHLQSKAQQEAGVTTSSWGESVVQRGGTNHLRTCRKPLPGKNKASGTSGQRKSSAFCFTESRCLLSALPLPPKHSVWTLPSLHSLKKRQIPQVFIAFIIKRHHYFLPAELPG